MKSQLQLATQQHTSKQLPVQNQPLLQMHARPQVQPVLNQQYTHQVNTFPRPSHQLPVNVSQHIQQTALPQAQMNTIQPPIIRHTAMEIQRLNGQNLNISNNNINPQDRSPAESTSQHFTTTQLSTTQRATSF